MKRLFLLAFVASIFFTNCQKNTEALSSNFIRGKLIRDNCGFPVVQILDPSQFDKGQDSWSPSANGEKSYSNVFLVDNPCSILEKDLKEGDEFEFKIVKDANCDVVCSILLLDNPTVHHKIEVKE